MLETKEILDMNLIQRVSGSGGNEVGDDFYQKHLQNLKKIYLLQFLGFLLPKLLTFLEAWC